MRKVPLLFCVAMTALTGAAPVQAFPIVTAVESRTSQPVEKVQWDGDRRWRGRDHWRGYDRHRYDRRHYDRRAWRHHNRRHYNRGKAAAVIGGLAAGAIIGGAIAQSQQQRYEPARRYVGNNSHVTWCYNRYRSYNASDNTFQPYGGPRQQCYSPYAQ